MLSLIAYRLIIENSEKCQKTMPSFNQMTYKVPSRHPQAISKIENHI